MVPLGFSLILLIGGAGLCLSKCIMPGSQIQNQVSRIQLHRLRGGGVVIECDISSPVGISL